MIINPCCDMEKWEVMPTTALANADNYYTKAQTDDLIDGISGITPSEVETEIDNAISVYNAQVQGQLETKADWSALNDYYNIQQTDAVITSAIAGKQDTLIAGDNITISGNVISASGGGGGGMTPSEVQSMIDNSISDVEIQIDDIEQVMNERFSTVEEMFNGLEYEIGNKQDTLSAGTNITIVDNVISAEAASITVDQTIIPNSTNAVSGGAVYAAIGDIETLLSQI